MGRKKQTVFRVCKQCGNNFELKRSGVDRIFCSKRCSAKGRYMKRVEPINGIVDLTTSHKECKYCNTTKEKDKFTIVRKKRDGYIELSLRNRCNQCYGKYKREQDKIYLKKEFCVSGAIYKRSKIRQIKLTYGLSIEEYHAMKVKQGTCAICEKDLSDLHEKQIHVDHDHQTGKVIGFLCGLCNIAIGALQENPEIIEKAKMYVIKNKTYLPLFDSKPPYK
jgi:hypothetical protein